MLGFRPCFLTDTQEQLEIPQFRLVAQIRLPVLDTPGKRPLSKLPADTMLADLYRLAH